MAEQHGRVPAIPGRHRAEARRHTIAGALTAALVLGAAAGTSAAPLALGDLARLARDCAPGVAVETLTAVAQAESGLDPLALNLNGRGGGKQRVGSREEAIALATELIVKQGRSVDLGLMQVNSANLARLGLSIAEAFDPCRNLAAGGRILAAGYAYPVSGKGDPQRALRVALSRYNTGHPERGFANGYVAAVEDAAERVVPAIRLRSNPPARVGVAAPLAARGRASVQKVKPPASWDVFGRARSGRELVFPSAVPTPPTMAPGMPG